MTTFLIAMKTGFSTTLKKIIFNEEVILGAMNTPLALVVATFDA